MTKLTAVTALGALSARKDVIGTVEMTEIAETVLASLAIRSGGRAAADRLAKSALGLDLPGPDSSVTGRSATGSPATVIWMGGEQFLVEGDAVNGPTAATLKQLFGAKASVTDQSDAWARFDLAGEGCPAMLERLCAANSRKMRSGEATRTPIHHMGCILVCRQAGTSFTVYGPRSSAASLHHALTTAAAAL